MTQDHVSFVLKIARAMHGYGYAAHRLEETLVATSERMGLEAQFFSTPTSIFAAFGPQDAQHTYLLRVQPGDTDLAKLAQTDRVALQVIRGEMTAADGGLALDRIASAPARFGHLATTLAMGLSSAAAARFFGGGWPEIGMAGLIGLVAGGLSIATARSDHWARLFEPLTAFVASALATVIAILLVPISISVAVLGGLIILIPGLTLTVAMTELATRHLSSGTARLASAILVFLTMVFGVALGGQLVQLLLGAPPTVTPTTLPLATEFIALAIAPLGFAVLLQTETRDLPWVMLAGWLAFGCSRLGAVALGPELGAFLGAFAAGVASNVYALVFDRPSQIPLVPGTLMLVPGSFGFRSVSALVEHEVVSGVETAFTMVFIATALVAGLLVANVIVPRRKSE